MGMYDEVIFYKPITCPHCGEELTYFQTKDLDRELIPQYRITHLRELEKEIVELEKDEKTKGEFFPLFRKVVVGWERCGDITKKIKCLTCCDCGHFIKVTLVVYDGKVEGMSVEIEEE